MYFSLGKCEGERKQLKFSDINESFAPDEQVLRFCKEIFLDKLRLDMFSCSVIPSSHSTA